ncbi:peptidoglycan-binding protein LysM [Myroides sp. LJL116]
MRKKCSFFIGSLLLVAMLISSFKQYELLVTPELNIAAPENLFYANPQEFSVTEVAKSSTIPFTGKTYMGFKQALGVRESNGLYDIVNSYGYLGKYQFGKLALRSIGIVDASKFLQNPLLQEKAFDALVSKNKWILRKEIKEFHGKRIAGIHITESGLIAAAHLGGAGSVKKFLKSNGAYGFKDGYGTSIKSYLKRFSGYDISQIQADKNAVVSI